MKMLTSVLFRWYFFRVLTGRYIAIERPNEGRYSRGHLQKIYKQVKKEERQLSVAFGLSQIGSRGNRLMVHCGIISLAAYRGFRKRGLSHEYATLLVADVIWKLYILGTRALWILTGLSSREPQKRLNTTLRILLKYPFNADPEGYQFEAKAAPDHFCTHFTQCAVHRYLGAVGNDEEMDFFRNSWCRFDFALPACLTREGGYVREHTLSHGDPVCDMRWYAKFPRSTKGAEN